VKPRLLQFLVCPACHGRLDLDARSREGEEVMEGQLSCLACSVDYPVRGGIPCLIPGALSGEKSLTAAAFGYEWRHFTELHEQYREQFLDWMVPIQPGFFADKVVLDAGCGTGRHADPSSEFGAREVIAMDLSEAVLTAFEHIGRRPNVHVIQADIYTPPIRPGTIDLVYSIGVLHHLPDPEAGFQALVPLLRPGGTIHAWVYGHENNGIVHNFIDPLRRGLTRHLPHAALNLALALPMTVILEALIWWLYVPLAGTAAFKRLPSHAYLHSLRRFNFRQNHSIVFDHLVAPTAYYLKQEAFRAWFQAAGLEEIQLSWRNENSWRGTGRAPEAAD
jgi:SAM-dependent methyltransferase/uncharacterized protein YbaR (Trm112 family)